MFYFQIRPLMCLILIFIVYVDAKGGSCNAINLDVNTASSDNTFNIQITQLACDFNNLAPPGCTQYFYGSTNGIFQSFNWDGGNHLANQNQNICFRYYTLSTTMLYIELFVFNMHVFLQPLYIINGLSNFI